MAVSQRLPDELRALLPERVDLGGGLLVALDADEWAPKAIAAVLSGRYEEREARLVADLVPQGASVVEAGTAIGFVAMCAARASGTGKVITYDGNPAMTAAATRSFAINGLSAEARTGVLFPRARASSTPPRLSFRVDRNFLVSGLGPASDAVDGAAAGDGRIDVPTVPLENVIAECGARILIVDIEGGERDLLIEADLAAIETLIVEVHPAVLGVDGCLDVVRSLVGRGFRIDVARYAGDVMAFRRGHDGAGADLATAALRAMDAPSAEARLRRLAAVCGRWPQCRHLAIRHSEALLAAERAEDALAEAERAGDGDDTVRDAVVAAVRALLRLSRPARALEKLAALHAHEPATAETLFLKGRCAIAGRDFKQAKADL
jgi:FkbM family methyltransferase